MNISNIIDFLKINNFEVSEIQEENIELNLPKHVYATDPKTESTIVFTEDFSEKDVLEKIDNHRKAWNV